MRGMEPVEGVTSPCPVCGTPRPIDGADRAHCAACGEDREVPPLVLEAARAYRRASANLPLQLTQTSDLGALARTADDDYQRFRRFMTIAAIPAVILFVPALVRSGSGRPTTKEIESRSCRRSSRRWPPCSSRVPGCGAGGGVAARM
ncbi:MAG: hypothetical protein V9G29_19445 [Burkholderiaceae bacterium]